MCAAQAGNVARLQGLIAQGLLLEIGISIRAYSAGASARVCTPNTLHQQLGWQTKLFC